MKHLFIINPVAGGRNGKIDDIRGRIEALTAMVNDAAEIYVTKAPMDACRKIAEEADAAETGGGELRVYACGGDGTLSECVNAAAGRVSVSVTHYPCGTGNDFLKTYSPEGAERFRDLRALLTGTVKTLDIIECSYQGGRDSNGCRFGINICSVGIDARVGTDVHKYSKIPVIGGSIGYVVSLIVNVIKGVTQTMRVTTKGESLLGAPPLEITDGNGVKVFDRKLTLACVCNGRYYGGGFNPVPDALPDDGVLDCLIVEPVSRLQVAQIVGRFSKGRFAEFPNVFNYVRCTEMEIEADREFVVNIDGERVYAKRIGFRVVPRGVNFIFPDM